VTTKQLEVECHVVDMEELLSMEMMERDQAKAIIHTGPSSKSTTRS
jgi:hypothetical protein